MFSSNTTGETEVSRGESTYAVPGTYTWVCPAGVTSVSVVVVGGGASGYTAGGQDGGFSRATFGATVVQANGGVQYSFAGGTGGSASGGDANYTGGNGSSGGGGAAGYAGNGGNAGSAGAGGSGGGGDNGYGSGGGGVGLFGQGTSGAAGSAVNTTGGGGGSGGQTALYSHAGSFGGGGGQGLGSGYGGGGGGLAYKNNITVTPGTSYTIVVGLGGRTTQANGQNNGKGGDGAVRIIWPGATRTFPSTDVGTP